jgi:hypothetical protein
LCVAFAFVLVGGIGLDGPKALAGRETRRRFSHANTSLCALSCLLQLYRGGTPSNDDHFRRQDLIQCGRPSKNDHMPSRTKIRAASQHDTTSKELRSGQRRYVTAHAPLARAGRYTVAQRVPSTSLAPSLSTFHSSARQPRSSPSRLGHVQSRACYSLLMAPGPIVDADASEFNDETSEKLHSPWTTLVALATFLRHHHAEGAIPNEEYIQDIPVETSRIATMKVDEWYWVSPIGPAFHYLTVH